ncbi:Response regulatory domain-containing protein [Gammaproteobacteria bacterium]
MSKPLILIVEDEPFMQELMTEELSGYYQITIVDSGKNCLAALAEHSHDLILLDVELPDMDGYEICRMIKVQGATAEIPVLFVSSHDRVEDRLKGYEMGGADYVAKPFDAAELRAKIAHLLWLYRDRRELKVLAKDASQTAMTAMMSLGELGVIIDCLKSFPDSNDLSTFVDAVLRAIANYDLEGTVQIRVLDQHLTRSSKGESTPLELSVINLMTSMERVLQYKSRLSIAYPNVSLLIRNMPIDDPDRCGRLRDHLAILCGAVEIGAMALAKTAAIRSVIGQISEIFSEIKREQQHQHVMTYVTISEFNTKMSTTLLSMALTDVQEEFLFKIIEEWIGKFTAIEGSNVIIQERLKSIASRLESLL